MEVVNRTAEPVDEEWIRHLATGVLNSEAQECGLSVAFVQEPEMVRLNETYRRLRGSTDVLSFPTEDEGWPEPEGSSEGDTVYLGDVVICAAVGRDNAAVDGVSPEIEIGMLVIHGVLHLLGYDHEVDDGEMVRRERELRTHFLSQRGSSPSVD